MPDLKEIIAQREKKFVKKKYRPWDLTGDGAQNISTDEPSAPESPSVLDKSKSTENPIKRVSETKKSKPKAAVKPVIAKSSLPKQEHQEGLDTELGNDLDNNEITIREQLDNKQITIGEQKGSALDNKQVTIREQLDNDLDNKLNPNSLYNCISKLSGVQRKILEIIIDVCLARNSLESGPIESRGLAQLSGTTPGSLKTSLNRLINKGLVIRNPGKTARGGYISLTVPEKVKTLFLNLKNDIYTKSNISVATEKSLVNSKTELGNNSDTILGNNDPYNSNSNYITTKKGKINLPYEWSEINIEPLQDIGFSQVQVKQLYSLDVTTPELLQESINHFAFGLQHNPKCKEYKTPLNVFMGVLRKGQLWTEPDYKSPQEIAMEEMIKRKQEEKHRLKELEKQAFEVALDDWTAGLSIDEKTKIAGDKPEHVKGRGIVMPEDKLDDYFKKEIWPNVKKKYMQS